MGFKFRHLASGLVFSLLLASGPCPETIDPPSDGQGGGGGQPSIPKRLLLRCFMSVRW